MTETPTAERYVAGTLSEEEVARFEEAMIERPELAADVNVRRRVKAGLALLEQRNELEPLLAAAARPPQYMRYAAAAAVLVVMAGLWSTWRSPSISPQRALFASSEIGAAHVGANYLLARTRSADVPAFDVQREAGLVKFRILVDDPGAAPFGVVLARADDPAGARAIGKSAISETTGGFAEVFVDPKGLDSGNYSLALKGQSGADQNFPFTLNITP